MLLYLICATDKLANGYNCNNVYLLTYFLGFGFDAFAYLLKARLLFTQ